MKFLTRYAGTVTALGALIVLVVGGFLGVSMLWTFLVAFALILLGAALVNGAYVLRKLVVVIPTLFIITAFTFYLQSGRGDQRHVVDHGAGQADGEDDQIQPAYRLSKPGRQG